MEGQEERKATYDIVWDVEGPLIHPGFDFAREILKENSAEITENLGTIEIQGKEHTYFEAAYEVFDPYDDERWLYDRTHDVEFKHSTGTTPVISLIICALMNWNDEKLIDFARRHFLETPGCSGMHDLMRELNAREFLVSNSYAAQCLTVAEKKHIPFSDAYCMGYQLDGTREIVRDFEREVGERSPLDLWREHSDELKAFLDAYLQNAGELREVYEKANAGVSNSGEKIPVLLSQQKALFEEINHDDLRESLTYFLDKADRMLEKGVMGGQRKKHTLQEIRDDGENDLLFVSDSIVDVDAIEYVNENGLSVTINCTQQDCLKASQVSIATVNWNYAREIMRDLASGNLKRSEITQETLEAYVGDSHRPYIRLFAMEYTADHLEEVTAANKTARDALKDGYELWRKDRNAYQAIWSNQHLANMPGIFS